MQSEKRKKMYALPLDKEDAANVKSPKTALLNKRAKLMQRESIIVESDGNIPMGKYKSGQVPPAK